MDTQQITKMLLDSNSVVHINLCGAQPAFNPQGMNMSIFTMNNLLADSRKVQAEDGTEFSFHKAMEHSRFLVQLGGKITSQIYGNVTYLFYGDQIFRISITKDWNNLCDKMTVREVTFETYHTVTTRHQDYAKTEVVEALRPIIEPHTDELSHEQVMFKASESMRNGACVDIFANTDFTVIEPKDGKELSRNCHYILSHSDFGFLQGSHSDYLKHVSFEVLSFNTFIEQPTPHTVSYFKYDTWENYIGVNTYVHTAT